MDYSNPKPGSALDVILTTLTPFEGAAWSKGHDAMRDTVLESNHATLEGRLREAAAAGIAAALTEHAQERHAELTRLTNEHFTTVMDRVKASQSKVQRAKNVVKNVVTGDKDK